MKEKPLVSVICITYGHEDYIAQALDSFLMQKTTFPYQILVGEDKGPDRTAEIVLEYAEKYPDRIVPFIREENMGAQRNLIDLCRRAGTPYVAFCEGDDYWTDEYKLQKQYDFMEAHPEYRACFHNTRIQTDTSWYLYNYYNKDEDGNIFLPESIPDYDSSLRQMRMDYYIQFGPAHTSSLFYRWDNSREIPDWYYRHIYGDHSLVMIQVGDGLIGYIPETMSVYRRSEVGVLMYGSRTEHFLRSRESWIEMACDLERYFLDHYNTFANTEIRARIIKEFNSYTRFIVSSGNEHQLEEVYAKYTYPASLAAEENMSNYRMIKTLENLYTSDGLKWILWDDTVKDEVRAAVDKREALRIHRLEARIDAYIEYAKKPKDKSVWVFSHEDMWSYKGNVRHLYEYILAYHPEIHPVWVTKSAETLKNFVAEEMPCAKIGTKECFAVMKKASVAFTDQFRTSAYNFRGFNKGMKLVRLGNGYPVTKFYNDPLISADPQRDPRSNAEEVVCYDERTYRGIAITDENRSFFTENYADTFMQVAANRTVADIYTEKFGVPEESIFICGAPRSFAVPDNSGDRRRKILMIPEERTEISVQESVYETLTGSLDLLVRFLDETDTYMTLCLPDSYHPSISKKISGIVDKHNRIDIAKRARDIVQEMRQYDVMITDRSSLMYDFALQDKPVVVIDPDKDKYIEKGEFLYDYDDLVPGAVAYDWETGLEMVRERLKDPAIDREIRRKALAVVCDMTENDADNSERIIQEIKRRLEGTERQNEN